LENSAVEMFVKV